MLKSSRGQKYESIASKETKIRGKQYFSLINDGCKKTEDSFNKAIFCIFRFYISD